MIRRYLVLALALCLCLTAACSGGKPSPEQEEPAEAAAPAPVEEETVPTEEPAGQEDFTTLSAEDCVEETETGLPRLTLACSGADAINEKISEDFLPLLDDPSCEGVSYACYKGTDRVLSLLMWEEWPNDCVFYTPFDLDLTTGEQLTGGDLLALLDVDTDTLAAAETAVLGETFQEQFAPMKDFMDDTSFYDEQFARTTDPENVELERVWLDDEGQLCFAGRVYGMAGAEFYENALGTGLYLG